MERVYKFFEVLFVISVLLLILVPIIGDYAVNTFKVAKGDFTLAVLAFAQLSVVSGLLTLIFESTRNDLMSLGASKAKRGIEYLMMGLGVALAYPLVILFITYIGVSASVKFLASMALLTFLFLFGSFALNYAGFEIVGERFSSSKLGKIVSLLGLFAILVFVVGIPVFSLEAFKGAVDTWLVIAGATVNALFLILLLSYLSLGMETRSKYVILGSALGIIAFLIAVVKFSMLGGVGKGLLEVVDAVQGVSGTVGLGLAIWGLSKLKG